MKIKLPEKDVKEALQPSLDALEKEVKWMMKFDESTRKHIAIFEGTGWAKTDLPKVKAARKEAGLKIGKRIKNFSFRDAFKAEMEYADSILKNASTLKKADLASASDHIETALTSSAEKFKDFIDNNAAVKELPEGMADIFYGRYLEAYVELENKREEIIGIMTKKWHSALPRKAEKGVEKLAKSWKESIENRPEPNKKEEDIDSDSEVKPQ